MRPGILDSLKQAGGIQSDLAMARLAGIPIDEYENVKAGKESPSAMFLAQIAYTFGKNVDQLATVKPENFRAAA